MINPNDFISDILMKVLYNEYKTDKENSSDQFYQRSSELILCFRAQYLVRQCKNSGLLYLEVR